MQSHANVVTASGGGCGDSSWDHHDDGGSKDVTGRTSKPAACLSAAAIVLELLLRKLGSVAMHTGTMIRGAVAGPRRATHGAAVVDRSLLGCSKRAAMKNGMTGQQRVLPAAEGGHGGGLLSCTIGSSAQYTDPYSTGGHLFALQFALTAVSLPPLRVILHFTQQPPRLDCLDWR